MLGTITEYIELLTKPKMMMIMIGLESNVAYNDHELPSQLSPDQYFKLEWALSEDRQELAHEENGGEDQI